MKPIQLWLPMISGGAARSMRQRDIQRLHAEWDGHDVLWTQPGWNGAGVWQEACAKVGCISGGELECFRILHIGGGGGIQGPAAAEFGEIQIEGLLDAWLASEVDAVPSTPGSSVEIKVPAKAAGGVTYRRETFALGAAGHYPIRHMNETERVATAQWPPDQHDPTPISPQSETTERYPLQSDSALVLRVTWKEPFGSLMPMFSTEDDLFAQGKMRQIIEFARIDGEHARKSAELAARDWLVEGQSTVNAAWLKPIIAAEGEIGAVIAIQSRFDVECESLIKAYSDEGLRRELRKPIGVRRALGVTGLAWALLLDRLNKGQQLRLCELCGSSIKGRTNKRFCSQSDNAGCYRARKRGDRLRARSRVGSYGP